MKRLTERDYGEGLIKEGTFGLRLIVMVLLEDFPLQDGHHQTGVSTQAQGGHSVSETYFQKTLPDPSKVTGSSLSRPLRIGTPVK